MKYLIAALLALGTMSAGAHAQDSAPVAQITVLGEVHDNPAHHLVQEEWVARIEPAALVFEMLSPEQVKAAQGIDRHDGEALQAAFDWNASGWPDFEMYAPIFAAAPDARLYGAALPKDTVRAAIAKGASAVFGPDAAKFGLGPIDGLELAQRVGEQNTAHCGMLPSSMLPGMVEAQRLRDAHFAQVALQALDDTGGPVVVITGDGHARKDWGIPAMIHAARPDVTVFSLGQLEDGATTDPNLDTPPFDQVLTSPAPTGRGNPCEVFR
ncbi:MAG: hypothetical protein GC146_11005 [Limimaricola sp.]|uniref:ChaN family lipoprotein n=1 Tax=Limimaricola sp. TaxID=2211665 RepID=UPI001D1B87A3|nr:ChaN family lipoprotein [Limimaricola sp.]MBI1417740.1 hypothetical protein [Limimaricola sp.]